MTLICMPTVDNGGLLSSIPIHLEKAPCFTLIKLEKWKIKEINVIKGTGKHIDDYKVFTKFIEDLNVDVVICGCLGEQYKLILYENSVEVFSGEFGKVKDVFNEWRLGFYQLQMKNSVKMVVKNHEEELNENSHNFNRA